MTDILVGERQTNRRAAELGLDIVPATYGEGFGAAFDDALTRNPLPSLTRALERSSYYPYTDEFGQEQPAPNPSKMLTADEATARYGVPGRLAFDTDTPEPVAQQLNRLKQQEIQRQETMRRAGTGVGTSLSAGLIASFLDPINIASAFIPVIGPSRYAALSARFGAIGARTITGAAEGAVGAAVVEPIVLAGALQERADYGAVDSLMNIAFGTALGSGLHLGAGYVGDRLGGRANAAPLPRAIDELPRADQEALLRTAVAQLADDRQVSIDAILRAVAEAEPVVRQKLTEAPPEGQFSFAQMFGRDIEAERLEDLTARQAVLQAQLSRAPARAPEAQLDQAARIAEIERQLADPEIMPPAERALRRRRDELAADVDPADLRLAATAAEQRRVLEAQIENIADEMRQIEERRRAGAVGGIAGAAAVDKATRLQAISKGIEQLRERTAPVDEARAAEAATVRAEKESGVPKPVDDEIADVEAELTELEQFLPAENKADVAGTDAATKEANLFAKAWQEAAACRIRMF